jgi:hypothetical protein
MRLEGPVGEEAAEVDRPFRLAGDHLHDTEAFVQGLEQRPVAASLSRSATSASWRSVVSMAVPSTPATAPVSFRTGL